MKFLEKNLEDIIFETKNISLIERGLDINGLKIRQLRIGNYGISDLVTFNRKSWISSNEYLHQSIEITVFELKKDKIDANSMMQAFRYIKGISRFLDEKGYFNETNITYRVVVVGKEICKGDFIYLSDNIENLNCYTYDYEFNGIKFKKEYGYYLKNESF